MKKHLVTVVLSFILIQAFSQKEITLEDIWAKGTFRPEYVWGINWMNDGAYYSSIERTEDGLNIILSMLLNLLKLLKKMELI